METCVFDEVLEIVSNDDVLSLSIYYFKSNLQIQCQARSNGRNKNSGGFQLKFTLTMNNY